MNTYLVEKPPVLQSLAGIRLKPKIEHAIEVLVRLNDRRTVALAAGDRQALLEIAAEYMLLGRGCPRMAAQVTAEAERCAVRKSEL